MDVDLSQALAAIRSRWSCAPKVGIILGTGLGSLTAAMRVEAEVSYCDIPYFPRSTAMAHKGALLCGTMAGLEALVMAGRCHLYEGYSVADIQFPIRVMHALGIELLMITNAAGGLNPQFRAGDVMVIDGHLNLMSFAIDGEKERMRDGEKERMRDGEKERMRDGEKERMREREYVLNRSSLSISPSLWLSVFSSPYDSVLIDLALAAARRSNFSCQRGVYVGVKGPNYETRAEYRTLRRIGGDAVGMSTIPEALAARELGLKVLGLSTITNIARPDAPRVVTSDEVVHVAGIAEPKVRQILLGVLESRPLAN